MLHEVWGRIGSDSRLALIDSESGEFAKSSTRQSASRHAAGAWLINGQNIGLGLRSSQKSVIHREKIFFTHGCLLQHTLESKPCRKRGLQATILAETRNRASLIELAVWLRGQLTEEVRRSTLLGGATWVWILRFGTLPWRRRTAEGYRNYTPQSVRSLSFRAQAAKSPQSAGALDITVNLLVQLVTANFKPSQ